MVTVYCAGTFGNNLLPGSLCCCSEGIRTSTWFQIANQSWNTPSISKPSVQWHVFYHYHLRTLDSWLLKTLMLLDALHLILLLNLLLKASWCVFRRLWELVPDLVTISDNQLHSLVQSRSNYQLLVLPFSLHHKDPQSGQIRKRDKRDEKCNESIRKRQ